MSTQQKQNNNKKNHNTVEQNILEKYWRTNWAVVANRELKAHSILENWSSKHIKSILHVTWQVSQGLMKHKSN